MKDLTIKKYLFTVVILLASAFVLDIIVPGLNFFSSKIGRQSTASLMIKDSLGRIRQFSGEVIEQMTVLDALLASSQGGLRVEYGKNGDGAVLLSVDGRSGPLKIRLNGRLISVEKVNQIIISEGDLIKVELP